MVGKQMRFIAVMAAAAGVPYAWFNENVGGSLKSGWQKLRQGATGQFADSEWTLPVSGNGFTPVFTSRDPGAPSIAVANYQWEEVLRFDVTSASILQRWPRVSTVRAERDLIGFRVPLITGTEVHDFAGSLTYYFNAHKRLCRITLHGQTGDDTRLVEIATKHYKLHPEPSLEAGIYLLRWNSQPLNVMRVSHAPIVRSDDVHARFIIELELNDVGGGYGLSPEFQQILLPDDHVRMWNT